MSSARHDYQQFLTWLHLPERGATEDTRRFANLVDQEFDTRGRKLTRYEPSIGAIGC